MNISAKTEPDLYFRTNNMHEDDIKKIRIIKNGKLLDIAKDYVQTWIDLTGEPFKYEFQGDNNGYLDVDEILITR